MDIPTLLDALIQLGIMPIFISVIGIGLGFKILNVLVKSVSDATTIYEPAEPKQPEPEQPVIYRIPEPPKEPDRPHCAWCGYYYPKTERRQRGTCPRCGAPNMYAK